MGYQTKTQTQRARFHKAILDIFYKSAKKGGAGAGTFIWQFIVPGMDEFNNDFGFVPAVTSSIYKLLTDQTCKLARLKGVVVQHTAPILSSHLVCNRIVYTTRNMNTKETQFTTKSLN